MKNIAFMMGIIIALLCPVTSYSYKELTTEELEELKTFPEHFVNQRLILKDELLIKKQSSSYFVIDEDYGFSERRYMRFTLRSSGLTCMMRKDRKTKKMLAKLSTGSSVTLKGTLIKKGNA